MKGENKLDQQIEQEFAADVLDLKAKLSHITGGSIGKKKSTQAVVKRLLWPGIAIAASLLLVVMLLPQMWNTSTNADLYAQYNQPYPMALNQRGDGEARLNEAISSYVSENFELASTQFENLYDNSKNNIHLLYAASAYQANGSLEKALTLYEQVIQSKDKQVVEQAQWYASLILINLDRIEEAKTLLESVDEEHYKAKDVSSLLRKL